MKKRRKGIIRLGVLLLQEGIKGFFCLHFLGSLILVFHVQIDRFIYEESLIISGWVRLESFNLKA